MHPYLRVAACTAMCAGPTWSLAQTVELGGTPAGDVVALAEGTVAGAVAALPEAVAMIMENSGVPGMAVAVVHDGEIVFMEGFGIRDVRTGEPVTPDTVFQIASLSKSISATVAAIAVSRGEVSWEDPVRDHLPELELSDPYVSENAVIGDFFSHRSGLPDAAGDELEDLGYERSVVIDRLALMPLDRFRSSYHYTNFGFTIGAEAVAAAVGRDWEDVAEAYLYEPLGMTSTSSRHEDFLRRSNAAALHTFENGRFQALYERDPDQQSPAGGVSSNVRDLARWLQLVLAGGLTPEGSLFDEAALLPALQAKSVIAPGSTAEARSSFYGYGFNVGVSATGRPYMSHSGGFLLGAATHAQMLPSEDVGIIVLSNGGPVGAVEAVAAHFLDLVQFGAPSRDWFAAYNQLIGPLYEPIGDLAQQPPPVSPALPSDLDSYAGTYHNAYFGPAVIEATEEGLIATLGEAGEQFELEHWSGDVFAMTPRGENAPAGSRSSVAFGGDALARHESFVVDYLNQNGLGTWTRVSP